MNDDAAYEAHCIARDATEDRLEAELRAARADVLAAGRSNDHVARARAVARRDAAKAALEAFHG